MGCQSMASTERRAPGRRNEDVRVTLPQSTLLVTAFLRPLGGELLIPPIVAGIGVHRVVNRIIAGRQPIAAMRHHRAAAVRAGLELGAVPATKPGGSL